MERKKFMTGVLLVAVVLIWGVIILKVVQGSRTNENPVVENHTKGSVENVLKDPLRLDYRDPFLGEFVRVKQDKKPSIAQKAIVKREPEQPPVHSSAPRAGCCRLRSHALSASPRWSGWLSLRRGACARG